MLDRFIIAVESIAASLAALAANQQPVAGADAPSDADKPQRGRGRPPKAQAEPPPAAAVEQAKQAAAAVEQAKQAAAAEQAKQPAAAAEQAKQPAAAAAEQQAKSAAAAAEQAKSAPDYEPLKAATIELANAGAEGKAAAINILTKYGVKKASDAPPEKWAAMAQEMRDTLAELQGGDQEFA